MFRVRVRVRVGVRVIMTHTVPAGDNVGFEVGVDSWVGLGSGLWSPQFLWETN